MLGGEKYYGLELSFSPEDFQSPTHDHEDDLAVEAWNRLQGFAKAKAIALLLIYHVIQVMIILALCRIGNVFIEGICIVTSFLVYGFVIKRRWHSKSLLICSSISFAMFYVAARSIPSVHYSKFIPIVIGLLLVYSLYRVSIYVESHELKQVIKEEHLQEELESLGYHPSDAVVIAHNYTVESQKKSTQEYFNNKKEA
jgi:hypothetical protein